MLLTSILLVPFVGGLMCQAVQSWRVMEGLSPLALELIQWATEISGGKP